MNRYSPEGLSLAELANLRDEDIDLSDIPELTDEFFANARIVVPAETESVTLRLPRAALEAFRSRGDGYERAMSAILERYAQKLMR